MMPRPFASALLLLVLSISAQAGSSTATDPGPGFIADRYVSLWTKSPFAIATPETASAPAEYELVGLAQFGGISYASLIDKQTQEHFVLTSDKPARSLLLVSVSHGPGGTSAIIRRDGELLNLRQEQAPPAAIAGASPSGLGVSPVVQPLVRNVYSSRPAVHVHRRLVIVPSPPVK